MTDHFSLSFFQPTLRGKFGGQLSGRRQPNHAAAEGGDRTAGESILILKPRYTFVARPVRCCFLKVLLSDGPTDNF